MIGFGQEGTPGWSLAFPKGLLRAVSVSLMLSTAGCGVTYFSPSIVEEDGSNVTVVPMSMASIQSANNVAYTPRQLPEVFFAAAGGGSSATGAGALPAEPYLPTETRGQLD